MSDDSTRLSASGAATVDDSVDVEIDAPPPTSPSPEPATGKKARSRMALRIPDDEVARPSEPPPPVAAVSSEIAPARIITINPPPPAAAASAPAAAPAPAAPPAEAAAAALPPPAAPPVTSAVPRPSPASVAKAAPPAASRVPRPEPAPEPIVPPAAPTERHVPDLAETSDGIAITTSDLPVAESLPSVDAVELDEAESAAMLAHHGGTAAPAPVRAPAPTIVDMGPPVDAAADDSDGVDIPVDEDEEALSEPEISAEDVVSVESVPGGAAASPTPTKRRSFPPAAQVPIGMSSSPNVAAAAAATPRAASATSAGPAPAAAPAPEEARGASQSSAIAPPAVNEQNLQRKRGRPWWEELFNDDYLRASPKLTDAQVARECDFIEESLGVAKGAMILDLACGTGLQAIELTRRGYQVVGFDLSLSMLAKAAEEAQERDQKINFVQGDMREMTFEETFDGVYCWATSFGFFEEEKNAQVISRVHKALRSGGQFLLDVVNRDYLIRQSPSLVWFEGDGCVCMDEMHLDWITSRLKVKRTMMLDDGRQKEIEYSVRVYSLHELGKVLHEQGFRVVEVSGGLATPGVYFGNEAPRTLILAEKR